MNPKLVALFYLIALICFAASAGGYSLQKRFSLIPVGLALWLFPSFWVAMQAAGWF
jgi:hypothetical protein